METALGTYVAIDLGNYSEAGTILVGGVVELGTKKVEKVAKIGEVAKTLEKKVERALETKKLPRFDGPKPSYHVNPAHVPGERGFNLKKTPLPNDAEATFKNAVPNDPKNPTAWFGKNANGDIYRYSMSNDGTAHFSGIDGVGDGVRNLTKYAQDRMNGL